MEHEEEGWSYDTGNRVMCLTQRTAQQMPSLTPTMEIRAKCNLADRDILKILLYSDTGSCLNMISLAKARKDGIKIKQGPHPYRAKDVQKKPLYILGYAEYFLLN